MKYFWLSFSSAWATLNMIAAFFSLIGLMDNWIDGNYLHVWICWWLLVFFVLTTMISFQLVNKTQESI